MSAVYAIRSDGFKYQELSFNTHCLSKYAPEDVSLRQAIQFYSQNISVKSWWPELELGFSAPPANPKAEVPDIGVFGGTLVLSPRASRFLGDSLSSYGELLPISVGSERFYILNCLTLRSADEQKCLYEYYDGEKLNLRHLVLTEEAQDHMVFKVEAESFLTLYCNSRLKDIVEQYELTGLEFDANLLIGFPEGVDMPEGYSINHG